MTAPFPNAAPPPGALFDNAPSVGTPPPAHLIPASRICQDRGGRWMAVDVLMQYGRPIPLALALRRVAIGRTVFVRREDAGTVMEAATAEDAARMTDGESSRLGTT